MQTSNSSPSSPPTSLCLSLSMYVSLSLYICTHAYVLCLSVSVSVRLSLCFSLSFYVCVFLSLSVFCLSLPLPASCYIFLCVWLYVPLSIPNHLPFDAPDLSLPSICPSFLRSPFHISILFPACFLIDPFLAFGATMQYPPIPSLIFNICTTAAFDRLPF